MNFKIVVTCKGERFYKQYGDYSYDDKFLKIYPNGDKQIIVFPISNIESFSVRTIDTKIIDNPNSMSEQERW